MAEVEISDFLKANYADYYAGGDSEWRRLGALGKAANIVSLCEDLEHGSVLEIGAGEGAVTQRLSELDFGEELHALEVSPSGLEAIRAKRIPRLADCRIFDGYRVPYEDDRFDLAVLSHVLEHVEHPRLLLYEASRVARKLFVEVPLEDTVRLPRDFVFDRVGHINAYSPRSIRRLVQSCNLRVLRQITTNPPKESYVFRRGRRGRVRHLVKQGLVGIAPRVAAALFTYHGALVCEKTRS